jgi:hypothetical protein
MNDNIDNLRNVFECVRDIGVFGRLFKNRHWQKIVVFIQCFLLPGFLSHGQKDSSVTYYSHYLSGNKVKNRTIVDSSSGITFTLDSIFDRTYVFQKHRNLV